MTQNLTSNDLDTGKSESDKSSTEIRADIDQTRASVGDKIDQLQARLDPNRLKQQAQETVQEMLTDTANSMTEYVKVHKDEMVTSLADAARRNPLPTALVGLGIGWLILESMAGNRSHDERRSYDDRYYDGRSYSNQPRYAGSSGRSYVSQGRTPGNEPEYYPTSDWAPPGARTSSGQGYSSPSNQEYRSEYRGENYPSGNYASNNRQGSSEEYRQEYNQSYGNGHQQGENPIAKATGAVKDTLSDVGDKVGNVMGDLKDRVSDTMSDAKNRVGDTFGNMSDQVSNAMGSVKNRVGDTYEDMRDQAGQFSGQTQRSFDRAGNQMEHWQQQARYEGQRRGRQMVNHLEDNPLIYGAVAFAAGAALAFLLPQSSVENRAFGEMRDQVMDKGQDMLETAKSHAQQVIEEVRPELEQSARQIVSDVTETGKQAAKDAAQQLSPVVDKALSKSKEEAMNAAKEVGIDPSKMTGSTELNRDTFSGQWKQVKGEVKRKWGQLTDDDMTRIEGDYDKLIGSIQTRYGYTREQVEREIDDFFKSQSSQNRSSQGQVNQGQSNQGKSGQGQSTQGQSSQKA